MRTIVFKHPGIFLNLLFLAYFVFLEPVVMGRLLNVIEGGARDWLLAVAFLSAPFLELAGFYLAAPGLIQRLAQAPRRPNTLPILVWQAHLVLSIVLLLNGFACIEFDTRNGPPLLGIVLVAALIVKEVGILLYWIIQTDPKRLEAARWRSEAQRPQQAGSDATRLAASLLVMPFAALGFTGFWNLLVARNPIHWSQPGDAAVELALAVFIFMLVFAAARSIFLIEEWAFLRGRVPVLVWAGTLLLNLLLALAGLPRG